jgi:hypothetical protein
LSFSPPLFPTRSRAPLLFLSPSPSYLLLPTSPPRGGMGPAQASPAAPRSQLRRGSPPSGADPCSRLHGRPEAGCGAAAGKTGQAGRAAAAREAAPPA